ncbi:MAG: ABC transporter transmembrane domain-containing protein, partial [Dehalococcoidia bacterium]
MSTVSGEGNTRDHSRRRPANVEEEHKQLHESDEEMFSQLDSTVFKRFFYYSRPHRRKMLIALIAVIGFTLANLATPLMVKIGIDSAITTGDTELLAIIGVAMLANAVLYWVSMYFQRVLISEAALEVLYDIRADMFLQLQRLALSFSDKTPIGSLMARMFGDVGALQEMLES